MVRRANFYADRDVFEICSPGEEKLMRKQINRTCTRTALITGASRGLGLALAQALAGRGWNLILNARASHPLENPRRLLADPAHLIAIVGDVATAVTRDPLAEARLTA